MNAAAGNLGWLRQRLRPAAPVPPRPERDQALEGMRGLCALLVLYGHVFCVAFTVDPGYTQSVQRWWFWFDLSYPAVLLFFVLSGYVIGMTTLQPATATAIKRYLSRRSWRIVPVNTAAVLLTWWLWPAHRLPDILGNLCFLQNSETYPVLGRHPLLWNNPSLWSLNYEAFYYLVFIAVWRAAPVLWRLLLIPLAIIALQAAGIFSTPILAYYACGSLYWFAGLAVAWRTAPPRVSQDGVLRTTWLSALLAVYATWQLGGLRELFLAWHADGLLWPTPVAPHRLDFLPVSVWVLLAVTGRAPAGQRRLGGFCLSWASAGWAGRLLAGSLSPRDVPIAMALLAAWLLFFRPGTLHGLRRLAPVGAISFGIYVLGLPLQFALDCFLPSFAGSPLTLVVRLLVYGGLVIGAAWLLERQFCPWLRCRLQPALP
jgi:peptidoglycan/LPS O-acetylase OafA/YrhL